MREDLGKFSRQCDQPSSAQTVTEPGSKDTVNLPKTNFDMGKRDRRSELQKFWAEHQIYNRLSQNNPMVICFARWAAANGSLHIGHALNKILKDIINRYLLQGTQGSLCTWLGLLTD